MKRIWLILLAALVCLTGCGTSAPPETTTAEITEATVAETTAQTVPETTEAEMESWDFTAEEVGKLRLTLGERDLTKRLTDFDRDTGRLIEYGEVLTVESDSPFSALYLEWNAAPNAYLLKWEGGQAECGAEGFQHDYVRLPEAVTAVSFELQDYREPVLCEVRAFTEGAAPEGIQDWQAPCGRADLLVFPTHSDDDALFFGALMSYYAIEMNLDIQTAFMTKHHDAPERSHERLDGLWQVGIRRYPILGDAPDLYSQTLTEAKYEYAEYDILGWQVRQIRRFKPSVIVAHDLDGEYGHGGHMLNAHTLIRAVELAADEKACPDSGEVWDTPKLYFHLYPENGIRIDVDRPMEQDPRGRTPFQAAVDAYDCHKSQHWCDFRVSHSDPSQNCVEFGLYRSLVGQDTTGDLMDNIGYS